MRRLKRHPAASPPPVTLVKRSNTTSRALRVHALPQSFTKPGCPAAHVTVATQGNHLRLKRLRTQSSAPPASCCHCRKQRECCVSAPRVCCGAPAQGTHWHRSHAVQLEQPLKQPRKHVSKQLCLARPLHNVRYHKCPVSRACACVSRTQRGAASLLGAQPPTLRTRTDQQQAHTTHARAHHTTIAVTGVTTSAPAVCVCVYIVCTTQTSPRHGCRHDALPSGTARHDRRHTAAHQGHGSATAVCVPRSPCWRTERTCSLRRTRTSRRSCSRSSRSSRSRSRPCGRRRRHRRRCTCVVSVGACARACVRALVGVAGRGAVRQVSSMRHTTTRSRLGSRRRAPPPPRPERGTTRTHAPAVLLAAAVVGRAFALVAAARHGCGGVCVWEGRVGLQPG
jgi:hypothetical protein